MQLHVEPSSSFNALQQTSKRRKRHASVQKRERGDCHSRMEAVTCWQLIRSSVMTTTTSTLLVLALGRRALRCPALTPCARPPHHVAANAIISIITRSKGQGGGELGGESARLSFRAWL